MFKTKPLLISVTLICALPLLQACVPAAIVGGTTAGVMSIHDRRTTGTQADDETTEWKAAARIPAQFKDGSHVNFTSFNRMVLITGEVFTDEAKQAIGETTRSIEGVRGIYNELQVAPVSALSSRSNDSFIDSKVKARLVDTKDISAPHIKVVTERGQTHLMGIVSQREAQIAISIARTTQGVRKVINIMEVLPDEEIRRLDTRNLGTTRSSAQPATPAPVETR